MGMYTELSLATMIKDDENVIAILKHMAGKADLCPPLPDHPFFETDRWRWLFQSCSYYFVPRTSFLLEFDDIAKEWVLISRSDIKNYDGEIEKFIDWIGPHLADHYGQMIGYSRYEEDREPTILYAPGEEDSE